MNVVSLNGRTGGGSVTALVALILVVLWAGVVCTNAASVIRGPYLQRATSERIVIRWRTNTGTDSSVRYGTNSGDLSLTSNVSTITTNHIVELTGLEPETKYFYQIGTSTNWFATDTNTFFNTSPSPGTVKPFRIWAIGDAGTGDPEQVAVRNAYTNYVRARKADLWLMLGDNAYSDGEDAEYQSAVFNMYPAILRNTVVWPTLGNHDRDPAYHAIFTLPKEGEAGGLPSGTSHYYSFDYANVHFVCLDSADSDPSTNGAMCAWLRADLDATYQEWLVVYWHHPPYTKGSHNSDTEAELITIRQNIVPILENYGVDLVLCGHSHSYERSYLLDRHYGLSTTLTAAMKIDAGDGRENGDGPYRKPAGIESHQGAVYVVAGSSGQTGGGSLNHPAMFISMSVLGSLVIDVSSNRLDVGFVQTNAALGDYFTITKAPPPTNAPAAPTELVATAVSSTRIDLSWIDNADNEQGFKLERSTNGLDFTQIATIPGGTTNRADSGLRPETTYYYRVTAFNVVGNSDYSNTAQATTEPAPPGDSTPPSAVTNLTVTTVSSNRVTLTWTAPGDDGDLGTATRYDVRYSSSSITEANWSSATQATNEPAPGAPGNTQNFTITGLTPQLTYYFALKTADETNNLSALSNVPQATTLSVVPPDTNAPGPITNLAISTITTNSIRLTWTAPGDDGYTGRATGYDLRYSVSLITVSNWDSATQVSGEPSPSTAGTSQNFTVSGLSSGATYYFGIKTSDELNVSPLSNVPQGTTIAVAPDTNAPAAVTNLAISTVTSNSVRLTWTAPGDDGITGRATSYDVRYSVLPILEANWAAASPASGEPTPSSAGVAQNFTVNGLSAGLTYYFALKTADETNNISPLSNVPQATTPSPGPADTNAPAAVTNLVVISATTNSVTLAWTAPGDDANQGTASRYDARYSAALITEGNWASATQIAGEPAPRVAGSSQSLSVTGLSAGVTYFFAVKTFDENNNASPLSNPANGAPRLDLSLGTVLVASNSVWKYLDDGSDQSTAWTAVNFDDTAWASGPARLGYGLGGEATVVSYGPSATAKYVTTYFRRLFTVTDPNAYTNMLVYFVRDDGGIVFINGIEVFRGNMPAGTVTNLTLAASDVTGSGSLRFYPRNVSPLALRAGQNVVAVELHQSSRTSPDLSFNLQLSASPRCPGTNDVVAALSIARQGTNVVLRWPITCVSHVLEQASNIDGNWDAASVPVETVQGQYQATASTQGTQQIFRLRKM